jgi:hypothetical protein
MSNIKKNYKQFFKIQVNMVKLFNENILACSYLSKSPFPYATNKKLSDTLSSILINLIDTNEINYMQLKTCSQAEIAFFNTFINKSGAGVELKYKPITILTEDLTNRFTLLQNSVIAGNDSEEIVDELIQLISKLCKAGKITRAQAGDLITDII